MNVIITGATSGIGMASAFEFAAHGNHVIICGRRADRLEEIKKEISAKYAVKVFAMAFDIRNKEGYPKIRPQI